MWIVKSKHTSVLIVTQSTRTGYLWISVHIPSDISWVCSLDATGLASWFGSGDSGDDSLRTSLSKVTGKVEVNRREDAQSEANTAARRWSPSTVSSTQGWKKFIAWLLFLLKTKLKHELILESF